jgi:hypothetical protein
MALALSASAAGAAEWQFEDAGVPIAYADNGEAQFQFACRGGDFAMGFWVRQPHAKVAGASAMSLAITADPASGSSAIAPGTSFAQDMPLIHADGSSVIVRGPVARQWARIAQRAKAGMLVAYVRHGAGGKLEVFDGNRFDADGSSAAIRQVLDRCG